MFENFQELIPPFLVRPSHHLMQVIQICFDAIYHPPFILYSDCLRVLGQVQRIFDMQGDRSIYFQFIQQSKKNF